MPQPERRNPENAQLREKIHHIQEMSKQLRTLIDHVQEQTVAGARSGQVLDLPDQALATRLSSVLKEQRQVMSRIQTDLAGPTTAMNASPLITEAELAALMR